MAGVDQPLQGSDVGGGDGQIGQLDAVHVGPAGQLTHPPLAGRRGNRPGGHRGLDQVQRTRIDQVPHLQVGQPPVALQPATAHSWQLGQRGASNPSTHAGSGAMGTRSGSGKYR